MALTKSKAYELVVVMREACQNNRCVCSKPKERRKHFCRRCHTALPRTSRMGLGSLDNVIMAETYRDCVHWLEDAMFLRTGATQTLFGKVKGPHILPPLLKRSKPKPVKSEIIVYPDGREKCTGTEWGKRREEAFNRAGGRCERMVVRQVGPIEDRHFVDVRCNYSAPLHDPEYQQPGEAHHIKRRKERDDRLPNLLWCCWKCHKVIHKPEKVVPVKQEVSDVRRYA